MLFTDISNQRVVKAFKKIGFVARKEGKHTIMVKEKIILSIPRHKSLNPYTLKGIIKDAEITDNEFKELL